MSFATSDLFDAHAEELQALELPMRGWPIMLNCPASKRKPALRVQRKLNSVSVQ